MEHTPEQYDEPWQPDPRLADGGSIADANGEQVALCTIPNPSVRTPEQREAILCRIVACVNACAGIPTELLESHHVKDITTVQQELKDMTF